MQYLLAFYEDEAALALRERNDPTFWQGWRGYFAALNAEEKILSGAPLEDPKHAVTARIAADGRVVHDGPYADTKEQLGGFVVIEAASLDEAIRWAERCPAAREGAVEVRPVLPMPPPEGDPFPAARTGTFMISLYESADDFAARQGPDAQRYYDAWTAYGAAMRDAGIVADGAPLREPATATTVRVRDDGRTVHDGPYADTKEQLGGYFVLNVPTIDEALNWAARSPAAHSGAVEVRPLLVVSAMA